MVSGDCLLTTGLWIVITALGSVALAGGIPASSLKWKRAYWVWLIVIVTFSAALMASAYTFTDIFTVPSPMAPSSFVNHPAPLPNGQVVYVNLSGGNSSDSILRFDAQTGRELGPRPFPFAANFVEDASSDRLYTEDILPDNAGVAISAFRLSDGVRVWRYDAPGMAQRSILLATPEAFYVTLGEVPDERGNISGSARVIAFAPSDGHLLWQVPILANGRDLYVQLAEDGGILYTLGQNETQQNVIRAISVSSGTLLWQRMPPGTQRLDWITGDGHLYLLSAHNLVTALDARTGIQLWQKVDVPSSASIDALEVRAGGGMLYIVAEGKAPDTIGSDTKTIYAFDGATGSLRWKHILGLVDDRLLAVDRERVYVSEDALLIALRPSDGSRAWQSAIKSARAPVNQFDSAMPARLGSVLFVEVSQELPSASHCIVFCTRYAQDFVYAVDVESGSLYWRAAIGTPFRFLSNFKL